MFILDKLPLLAELQRGLFHPSVLLSNIYHAIAPVVLLLIFRCCQYRVNNITVKPTQSRHSGVMIKIVTYRDN